MNKPARLPERRLILGPFGRVEGELEVRLTIAGGAVTAAHVVSPLYRGFEAMLIGRPAGDALVYAPRICGICSVSQSVAAASALAMAQGLRPPPNGLLATALMHAVENVADHLTHFHLFFMPDFARAAYAGHPWHEEAAARFTALRGSAARPFLEARAGFLHMLGILAGKWPHSLTIQPGGSARAISAAEKVRLAQSLGAFRAWLEAAVIGDDVDALSALASDSALLDWTEGRSGDLARFLRISRALELHRVGAATGQYMSFGAYHLPHGPLFPQGCVEAGKAGPLDVGAIREDVSHGWYAAASAGPPRSGRTIPAVDAPDGYSWCKAPRLGGEPAEVGALARQLVDGQPLLRDLVARHGGSVEARIVARMVEVARLVPAMQAWVDALVPGEPFMLRDGAEPAEGEGAGLVEAARGALGHWLRLENGRLAAYQIIAPTTWNFSPRDAGGVPGPLEQALVGVPVAAGEREPVLVQHIVRSFDPCMVCTVH